MVGSQLEDVDQASPHYYVYQAAFYHAAGAVDGDTWAQANEAWTRLANPRRSIRSSHRALPCCGMSQFPVRALGNSLEERLISLL